MDDCLRDFLPDPYACICVNYPINFKHFEWIWRHSTIRICADGGAKQLLEWCKRHRKDVRDYPPHYIIGDFDSIDEETRNIFIETQTKFVNLKEDQDSTDLEKCLRFVKDAAKTNCTMVIGGLDGRFDHTMATLNALLKNANDRIVCVNRESMVWALKADISHEIAIDYRWMGPACGILPICGPSRVTTSGLEWDLCTW